MKRTGDEADPPAPPAVLFEAPGIRGTELVDDPTPPPLQAVAGRNAYGQDVSCPVAVFLTAGLVRGAFRPLACDLPAMSPCFSFKTPAPWRG